RSPFDHPAKRMSDRKRAGRIPDLRPGGSFYGGGDDVFAIHHRFLFSSLRGELQDAQHFGSLRTETGALAIEVGCLPPLVLLRDLAEGVEWTAIEPFDDFIVKVDDLGSLSCARAAVACREIPGERDLG